VCLPYIIGPSRKESKKVKRLKSVEEFKRFAGENRKKRNLVDELIF